ncbi:TraB family protein [Candidatus Woesearchaeota archaeon]|nr:TraB family protein [Candidatus Woesearchaeota archaeon]
MLSYKNIYLLGTSHIAQESIDKVKEVIETKKPDIVAVELDKKRVYALFNKRRPSIKDIKVLGIKGFFISLIGSYIEKKLGKLVGVAPGSEMKAAINLARKNKIAIALIDQDIGITLKKLSKSITWREKLRFLKEIIKGIITRKPQIEPFDIRKVPPKETIEKMIKMVKKSYPNVYKVLIEERNEVMAKNLYSLMTNNQNKTIFAIVGAGHEEGIIKVLRGNSR